MNRTGVIGGEGKKYFYHNDHLGSALVVTDEEGNIVVERDFTPFGERTNVDLYDETNRDPAEDDSGFTGKDWDADVELYYFNARWYDAEIGRFISEDSVADDPNLYSYGFGNPLKYIDPTGMFNFEVNFVKGGALLQSSISAIYAFNPELSDDLSFINLFIGINSMIAESKMITMKDLQGCEKKLKRKFEKLYEGMDIEKLKENKIQISTNGVNKENVIIAGLGLEANGDQIIIEFNLKKEDGIRKNHIRVEVVDTVYAFAVGFDSDDRVKSGSDGLTNKSTAPSNKAIAPSISNVEGLVKTSLDVSYDSIGQFEATGEVIYSSSSYPTGNFKYDGENLFPKWKGIDVLAKTVKYGDIYKMKGRLNYGEFGVLHVGATTTLAHMGIGKYDVTNINLFIWAYQKQTPTLNLLGFPLIKDTRKYVNFW